MERLADKFKKLVFERTGISTEDLACPREQSHMTPCVARDGHLAATEDVEENQICVGCGAHVMNLLAEEEKKHEG